MAVKRVSRVFKDISLSFEPHPVTNDFPVLKNANAITRSVRNLVETRLTERFFRPELGSDVSGLLFEFVDYGSADEIKFQVESLIQNYEPRVQNVKVLVLPRPDRNEFEATIYYDIVGLDVPSQEFTFILEATR